jgi:hypothetical protein
MYSFNNRKCYKTTFSIIKRIHEFVQKNFSKGLNFDILKRKFPLNALNCVLKNYGSNQSSKKVLVRY